MSDPQYDTLRLVGVHVPDYSAEIDAGGNKYQQELPGNYEVGVLIGDKFVALSTFKAGNMVDQIKSMKPKKASPAKPPTDGKG